MQNLSKLRFLNTIFNIKFWFLPFIFILVFSALMQNNSLAQRPEAIDTPDTSNAEEFSLDQLQAELAKGDRYGIIIDDQILRDAEKNSDIQKDRNPENSSGDPLRNEDKGGNKDELTFVEPKLTKHGDATEITASQFSGGFSF